MLCESYVNLKVIWMCLRCHVCFLAALHFVPIPLHQPNNPPQTGNASGVRDSTFESHLHNIGPHWSSQQTMARSERGGSAVPLKANEFHTVK